MPAKKWCRNAQSKPSRMSLAKGWATVALAAANRSGEARLASNRPSSQKSSRKSAAPLMRWRIETSPGSGRLRGLRLYQSGRFFFSDASGIGVGWGRPLPLPCGPAGAERRSIAGRLRCTNPRLAGRARHADAETSARSLGRASRCAALTLPGAEPKLPPSLRRSTRRAVLRPPLPGARSMTKQPVRVAVTGAAGQIGYSLLFRIAAGEMLGSDQPVILQLLEITPALPALKGVVMELDDCAFPLLHGVVTSDDPKVTFRDANIALLVGARPRSKGMERKDLLEANAQIFTVQGRALSEVASRDLRVLVVGNPANTNALIALKSAPGLKPQQFTAMMRLDHNRALSQVAAKIGKPVG